MAKKNSNPLWKVIITDIAGVGCLILFPFVAPIPGPGGIPLLISAFGFFAVNHDWADDAIHYIKKHSESVQSVIFPNVTWIKWTWDIIAVFILIIGTVLNIYTAGDHTYSLIGFNIDENIVKVLSYVIMAGSTTLFTLNRNRLEWLDTQLRRTGKK